jgi:hypothetical protein
MYTEGDAGVGGNNIIMTKCWPCSRLIKKFKRPVRSGNDPQYYFVAG